MTAIASRIGMLVFRDAERSGNVGQAGVTVNESQGARNKTGSDHNYKSFAGH
jgi:hypothetical protein